MPDEGQEADAKLEREARRLHLRYLVEVVEACGLCPWASSARLEGRMGTRVLLDRDPSSAASSLDAMRELEADPKIEVGFLVYPRLDLSRAAFERFCSRVREANGETHPLGEIPFVFAAFHPDAAPDVTHPERLIPFLRRTPDPTIQVLRADALDRVRHGAPQGTQFVDASSIEMFFEMQDAPRAPLRERIAKANLATVTRMGPAEFEEKLVAIRKDRDAAYAKIAD